VVAHRFDPEAAAVGEAPLQRLVDRTVHGRLLQLPAAMRARARSAGFIKSGRSSVLTLPATGKPV
jgi:hypothetical protein